MGRKTSGQAAVRVAASAALTSSVRPTRLQISTATRLLDLIRREDMTAGERLREEALAAMLGVSRTSVRGALRLLEDQSIVEARPRRGYRLRRGSKEIKGSTELPTSRDEGLYVQITRDRLAGGLPDSLTETDLMRRYGVGRHLVLAALALLSEDGIVHRGGGREWQFRPILKSRQAHEESYEFRLILEPRALLLPTFQLDKSELLRMKEAQTQLMCSLEGRFSWREAFQTGASFHELLAMFSRNSFVLNAIRQQNRLRRLLEYRSYLNATRVRAWCLEHVSVMDALLAGDRQLAASRLAEHLENARLVQRTS
jgi:DNA-binding GntR family transcriptional regulator